MEEMTINRLPYLFYLNRAKPQDCTVTKIAKLFSVSKSTVSRNIEYLEEHGIVFAGEMRLTEYGRTLTRQYAEEVELFQRWIEQTIGGDDTDCLQNAMKMAVSLSAGMKERLLQNIRRNELFTKLDPRGSIQFIEFSSYLPDGDYALPFVIQRENAEKSHFSMADRGFVHPAVLRMNSGSGVIRLKAVTMERRNLMDGLLFSGKLTELAYADKGKFLPTAKEGDFYQIPADALEYTFHKEENLLVGSLHLQMYAPLGKTKMHTREAILTVLLQKL